MAKYNKDYLVDDYAEYYGISKKQARIEINRFPDFVARELIDKGECNFAGFMNFSKYKVPARKCFNPLTNEYFEAEEAVKVNCKIGNTLKSLVKE